MNRPATPATAAIAQAPADASPAEVRRLLGEPGVEAVALPRSSLDRLPYNEFVRALLNRQGFKLDFRGQAPHAVLAMVADRLLGPGSFGAERSLLAQEIAVLEAFASRLIGTGAAPQTSIRTYFAPGDLVWHVDRVNERTAFRLLWPLGRPAGMRITSADNIDPGIYRAYMRREHPLLCKLDTRVLHTGVDAEQYWAHRPVQLEAMRSGGFPFLLDEDAVAQVPPDAISIHRVETPAQHGTYHCSSWANRQAPGLQVVITVAAD